MKRLFKILLYLLLSGSIAFILLLGLVRFGAFGRLPSQEEIANYRNAYASRIYASNGEVLGDVHSTYRLRLEDQAIPPFLMDALIAVEDQRFYAHRGIDLRGLFRALGKNVLMGDRSAGGGSTLSQQLVKNMYGRSAGSRAGLYINKIKEMMMARRLEKVLGKEEILTLYLNTVPFGENLYGVEAASERFFGKHTHELKLEEAATLVGMLKANTTYNPRLNPRASQTRRDLVLGLMQQSGTLQQGECDSFQALPLTLEYTLTKAQFNGYLNQVVESEAEELLHTYNQEHGTNYSLERDGLQVYTTIHAGLQDLAAKSVHQHLEHMQQALRTQYTRNGKHRLPAHIQAGAHMDLDSLFEAVVALHGGFLSMDLQNGGVLAYIGGKDFNHFPYDQILARRMMASTFKPFIYAAALEQGMHPCDYIENHSLVFEDHQEWEPRNYDRSEGGSYTLASALAQSLNIPAVRLYTLLDHDRLDSFWMGFDLGEHLPDRPATALGTLDASILGLSQAYSAFPNRGNTIKPHFIQLIISAQGDTLYEHAPGMQRSVCNPATADQMCGMLQLSVQQGTATSLRSVYGFNHPFAAKTGTSQEYRDAWTVGFNKRLLFAVRVGANDPEIHFNSGQYGASTKLALPILGMVLRQMDRQGILRDGLQAGFLPEQSIDMDCAPYQEDGPLRRWLDRWRDDRTSVEKERERAQKPTRWERIRDRVRDLL